MQSSAPDSEQRAIPVAQPAQPTYQVPNAMPMVMPQGHQQAVCQTAINMAVPATMDPRGAKKGSAGANFLMGGLQGMAHAQMEQQYCDEKVQETLASISADPSAGGFMVFWMDREAQAGRCRICPKYDTIMYPLRTHSSFGYDEMKQRVRNELDRAQRNYTLYAILPLFLSILAIPTMFIGLNDHRGDGLPIGMLIFFCLFVLGFAIFFAVFFCGVNLALFEPLRRHCAGIMQTAWAKQHGIAMWVPQPASCMGCCLCARKHVIVLRYGLTGPPVQNGAVIVADGVNVQQVVQQPQMAQMMPAAV